MSDEQEPVEHIQPLLVGVAPGPRFAVARAKPLRESDAVYGAGGALGIHQRLAKDILADTLTNHAFDLRSLGDNRCRLYCGELTKGACCLIRQWLRQNPPHSATVPTKCPCRPH